VQANPAEADKIKESVKQFVAKSMIKYKHLTGGVEIVDEIPKNPRCDRLPPYVQSAVLIGFSSAASSSVGSFGRGRGHSGRMRLFRQSSDFEDGWQWSMYKYTYASAVDKIRFALVPRSSNFPSSVRSMDLRVLILGSGGREHALAWKLAQSARVERLFVCPGNGGTAALPKTANVSFSGTNFEELVKFATENEVHLPLDLRDPVLILAMLGQSRCAWSGAAIGRWRGDVLP
jgi:hypothetical protein